MQITNKSISGFGYLTPNEMPPKYNLQTISGTPPLNVNLTHNATVKNITIYGNTQNGAGVGDRDERFLGLPNEYIPVDYIEFKEDKIDSGVCLTADTIIEAEINFLSENGGMYFGCNVPSGSDNNDYRLFYWQGSVYFDFGSGRLIYPFKNFINEFRSIRTTNYSLAIDGTVVVSGEKRVVFPENSIKVGGQNCFIQVRYFNIINNQTLQCRLIPAIQKSDNSPGLFDTISQVFHTSDNFVAGNVLPCYLLPIEFSGSDDRRSGFMAYLYEQLHKTACKSDFIIIKPYKKSAYMVCYNEDSCQRTDVSGLIDWDSIPLLFSGSTTITAPTNIVPSKISISV